jgi:hypothetical protein
MHKFGKIVVTMGMLSLLSVPFQCT